MYIIYCIINKINGKLYVGFDSKNNSKYLGSGTLIKKAINKYGKNNFSKIILEEVDSNNWEEKEKYWIEILNTKNPQYGYNIADGGEGAVGVIPWNKNKQHSKLTKQKISKQLKISNKNKKENHARWINLDINKIIDLNNQGYSYSEIGGILNVDKQLIYERMKAIKRKATTRHISGMKNKQHNNISKEKISNNAKLRIGNKNGNYKQIDMYYVLELKQQGYKLYEIANILSISQPTLRKKICDFNNFVKYNKDRLFVEGQI